MTKYHLKQEWLCIGQDFTVRDESGSKVFYVDDDGRKRGRTMSFQTASGIEVARIVESPPNFDIFRDGKREAVVRKVGFDPRRLRFMLDVPGPDDLIADGDLAGYAFAYTRDKVEVARVSRPLTGETKGYALEIEPEEDDILIIAATVVIDLLAHAKRK